MIRTTTTLSLAVLLMLVSLVSLGHAQDAAETTETPIVETEESVEPEAEEAQVEDTADQAAADDAGEKAPRETGQEAPEELPPLKPPSEGVQKLNKAVADITLPLDGSKRAHFFMMYNNHNLISTVKRVKGDVSNAIDACSKENPEMEADLRERYAAWQEAVDEQLDAAQANVNNMIIAQDYADEQDIRDVMKQADDLRDETMRQTERIPVTSKEACEYLLNKMDETQTNLVKLLGSTLVTVPKAMQDSNVAPEDLEDRPQEQEGEAVEEQSQEQPADDAAAEESAEDIEPADADEPAADEETQSAE